MNGEKHQWLQYRKCPTDTECVSKVNQSLASGSCSLETAF